MTPRIVIRKSTYRHVPGYTVTMYDGQRRGSWAPRVFVQTYRAAVRCKVRFKFGEEITLEDMQLA